MGGAGTNHGKEEQPGHFVNESNHTYLTVMTIISSESWVDKSNLPKEDESQLEESYFKQINTGISRYPRPKEVIMKMVMREVGLKSEEKGIPSLTYSTICKNPGVCYHEWVHQVSS